MARIGRPTILLRSGLLSNSPKKKASPGQPRIRLAAAVFTGHFITALEYLNIIMKMTKAQVFTMQSLRIPQDQPAGLATSYGKHVAIMWELRDYTGALVVKL